MDNSKNTLEISTRNINNEINYFGNYRKETLEKTIGRFNEYLRLIGKKSKDKTYDIPYSINAPSIKANAQLQEIKISSDDKMKIAVNASKIIEIGSNKLAEYIAKRKNIAFTPHHNPATPNSGNWILDLLASSFTIASVYAEQREAEKTAIEKYKSETNVLIEKINAQIAFYSQISIRINEIMNVTDEMANRCMASLDELKRYIYEFNVNNTKHMAAFQKSLILCKGISELAKVELLESENTLSSSGEQYLINSKKLLSSSL